MTKKDCVYFYEFQDMNARAQTCDIEAPKIIEPHCDKCNMYIKKDRVQVVRCKDCIHLRDHDCPIDWGKTDDDYCSFGARR